jgi:hypothetical protein
MSSREQCDQLLRTIDAVLSECSKDPRRQPPNSSAHRPPWPGPSWSSEPMRNGFRRDPDHAVP